MPLGAETPSRSTTPRSRSTGAGFVVTDRRDRRTLSGDGESGRQRHRRLARRVARRAGGPADAPDRLVTGTKGSHLVLDNPRAVRSAQRAHGVLRQLRRPGLRRVRVPRARCSPAPPTSRWSARSGCAARTTSATTSSTRCGSSSRRIDVSADQVVYSFSGIRPLPKSDHDFTGRISRGHFVQRVDGDGSAFLHDRREVDDVPSLRRTHDRRGAGGARTAAHDRDRSIWPSAAGRASSDAVGHRDGTGADIRCLRPRVPRISSTPTGPARRRSWRSAPSAPTTGRSASASN